jgi:hypothetical protein
MQRVRHPHLTVSHYSVIYCSGIMRQFVASEDRRDEPRTKDTHPPLAVDSRSFDLTSNEMAQTKFSEERVVGRIPWIPIIIVATLLIGIGMLAKHFDGHDTVAGGIAYEADTWLLGPGYFVAILLGFLGVLPGGAHSAGELFWLAAPISWTFYVLVGGVVFWLRRKIWRRNRT